MMNIRGVWESFAEGVEYTTEEGWVNPDDIEDPELRIKYYHVVKAYKTYARNFGQYLDKRAEEAGILD